MPTQPIEFAVVGGMREDYFITPSGEVHLRKIGGNAMYAAVGARLWAEHVGILSRVGDNYPREWLEDLAARGLDVDGIKILPDHQDTRTFYAYLSLEERSDTDPAAHFARIGQPLPPELADYVSSTEGQTERTQFRPLAVRPTDLPDHYKPAKGAHLAPYDYVVHHTLPETFRRHGVQYVTCDPSVRYMQPNLAKDVQRLVHGLDAFLPSEMETRTFFRDQIDDLWQAAEAFAAMGTEIVVLKLGARGVYVYAAPSKRRWHVPPYPIKVRDVTGAGDAFCGGFLVGLAQTDDPVEAALRGTISASVIIEGVGPLYALDSTPGLVEARLQSLRESVRQL